MSVHGEYERALENMILRLGQLPEDSSQGWIDAFSALRMKHQPDLTIAARECLAQIDRIVVEIPALAAAADKSNDRDPQTGRPNPLGSILNDSTAHLRAHCRAILGVSPLSGG